VCAFEKNAGVPVASKKVVCDGPHGLRASGADFTNWRAL
jgi:hypothetical protein